MAASEEAVQRHDTRLRLSPAACLPTRYPRSACRRCVDACPRGALIPTAGGPRLGAGCTECGQCVTRCPTEALSLPGFEPARVRRTRPTSTPVVVDCWRVVPGLTPDDGIRVPCLGGLSPAWLLELVAAAAERPVQLIDRGLCAGCPSGLVPDMAPARRTSHPAGWALRETARALGAIGLDRHRWPRLVSASSRADELDARHRPGAEAAAMDQPEPLLEARLSRRSLLTGRRFESSPPSRSAEAPEPAGVEPPASGRPRSQPQRRLQALQRLAPTAAAVPARLFPRLHVSASRCAQDGLCASVCPSGALRIEQIDGHQCHRFRASDCTGCGLCTELCPEQALQLLPGADGPLPEQPQTLTRFRTSTCFECGRITVGTDRLCAACARDQAFARSAFQTLFGPAKPVD